MTFKGYPIDEIDSAAKDLIQLICELEVQPDLAILSLCRAIVMLGNEDDLDKACRLIDTLSEIPFDMPENIMEEHDD